jgi:alkylation response protein AidB-like acyl-CoA dehydrogenase
MGRVSKLAFLLQHVIDGANLQADSETTLAILHEAERFAESELKTFAPEGDRIGCTLRGGAVHTAPGHKATWSKFSEAGWPGVTIDEQHGGQGLPMALAASVQIIMDAVDPAFGMLAINNRCAARLIEAHGEPKLKAEWLPGFSDGSIGASICISESQAGSDVGRIRTRARPSADGTMRIDGEKCWISYGDHDLVKKIAHFVLARSLDLPGTRGLSLFLVPNRLENDDSNENDRNGVTVLRLEEKLGLHASPTCTLRFDNAIGIPIGPAGRGLPTLFAMIVAMRLGVATQGAAVASAAADIAQLYAEERLQGGPISQPPIPIAEHADVRRTLLELHVRAEAACMLALQAAAWLDEGDRGDQAAAARAALLLPVAKTYGAEAAFSNADAAIQVLGGAGYVRDFPLERLLRDSRVFSIYEGTSGIQALDLLKRRVLDDGGLVLRDVLERLAPDPAISAVTMTTVSLLATQSARQQEAAALPFLYLVAEACVNGLLRRAEAVAQDVLSARTGYFAALMRYESAGACPRVEYFAARCGESVVDEAYENLVASQSV